MDTIGPLRVRIYGETGPPVIVLHGGPADAGGAAPLARGLADGFRVFEPWQRGSGGPALTVAQHVADLHQVVESPRLRAGGGGVRPALVGESWGAMLALAYAAAHPNSAGPLALVGCGTFDPAARARLRALIEERTTDEMRRRIERLKADVTDPAEQFRRRYELMRPIYSHDPIEADDRDRNPEPFDQRAHTETWEDMLRLQLEGVYPSAFAAIVSPVLMLHGAYDPHPGPMIRASLAPYVRRLEYREWEHCGHHPHLERTVRAEFFAVLGEWLARRGAPA